LAGGASKETLLIEAQRQYIEEQKSLNEIAAAMNVSRKTLSRWKIAGDWDNKKNEFMQNKATLHSSLYKLATIAVDELTRGMEEHRWDTQQVFAVKSLIQALEPSRKYETAEASTVAAGKLSPDELVAQVEQVLGVR
jgi:transposase-like protein